MKAWRRIIPSDLDLQNAERAPKTLKGSFDSPNQGELPGTVAFHVMARSNFFEQGFLCGANVLGIHTARMEITTRRWVSRIGNLASEQDTFRPVAWAGRGMAEMSASVYGCLGLAKSSLVEADSTILPTY